MNSAQRQFSICRTLGVLGFSALVLLWIYMGGCVGFIHAPGLMFTFGGTFLLLLATFQQDFLKFIPDSFLTLFCTPAQSIPRYADICRFGGRYAMASSLIAVFISYIHMIREMDDPSTIGAGFSLRLTPILYALLLSEVLFVYLYKAYTDSDKNTTPPVPMNNLGVILLAIGALAASFVTLYWVFIY
jgi:flagellar motor component MotA